MTRQQPALFTCFIFICLLATPCLQAQIKIMNIPSEETSPAIQTIRGAHIAGYNQQTGKHKKLVVMIGGTGSAPQNYITFDSMAADMGYNVIGLDYKNPVATPVCANSEDPSCFNNFREEICFGREVSPVVEVDSINSILNRLQQLLVYLVQHDADGNWDAFIKHGKVRWNKVIVAGHSQGAGHAGYLGQHFSLYRVLMFSGPQDFLVKFNAPAGWQSAGGVTSPGRYFAFLHQDDPFNVNNQILNGAALMKTNVPDTMHVGTTINGPLRNILIETEPAKDPHSDIIKQSVYGPVWSALLKE